MPDRPDELVCCRVCRTGLDVYTYPDKPTEYRHTDTIIRQYGEMITDHEPDPIIGLDHIDMIGVCDFCGSKHPRYTYPCRTFEVTGVPADLGMGMIGNWAACTVCHLLIEHDRWESLARRSADTAPAELWPTIHASVRILHQMFREHRTGPAIDHMARR